MPSVRARGAGAALWELAAIGKAFMPASCLRGMLVGFGALCAAAAVASSAAADNSYYSNRGKTRGRQGERALARIISGRGGMAWLPGTASRAPR